MAKKYKLSEEEEEDLIKSMESQRKADAVNEIPTMNFKCKNDEQGEFRKAVKDNEIIFCTGPAGTGKTYLACAMALKYLKSTPSKYRQIVLVKSVTTLQEEEIGFLKGTMREKMAPFVESFVDNFKKLLGSREMVSKLEAKGVIEILPIAYARGRTMDNSIIIIDEAQNISIGNIRTLLTRIGKDSKMIIMGDTKQTDSRKAGREKSLETVSDKLSEIDGIGKVRLIESVRNPIIELIEEKFDQINETLNK